MPGDQRTRQGVQGQVKIEVLQEDVTKLDVGAIQNAANGLLRHGAGVAGAIAKAGHPDVQNESNAVITASGALDEGMAVWTTAGGMPAKYVIHAVTMRFPGMSCHPRTVAVATQNTMFVAEALRVDSLALVALGTGIGGLDLSECAHRMLEVIHGMPHTIDRIVFAVHGNNAEVAFKEVVGQYVH